MRSASLTLPDSQAPQVARADSSRQLTGRIERVHAIKHTLVQRYRLEGLPMPLIREAIATAEAQAWLSGFPHLFLPDLADEILRQLRQKEALIHPEYAQAA
jgi:hypothetical protein